jgi:bacteriorhodopsin
MGNVMPQVFGGVEQGLMPKQPDLSKHQTVTLHGVTIDHKFVHVGDNSFLLSSICSVHVRGGTYYDSGIVALIIAVLCLTLLFIPVAEGFDNKLGLIFLIGILLVILWLVCFGAWSYVNIGTPAREKRLVTFSSLVPFKRKVLYARAKEVADALLSRIG